MLFKTVAKSSQFCWHTRCIAMVKWTNILEVTGAAVPWNVYLMVQ